MQNSLNYIGEVKIDYTFRGKTLKTITKHNSGTNILFKYIGYCLAGLFNAANDIGRPFKIRLYSDLDFKQPITNLMTATEIASIDTSKEDLGSEGDSCAVSLKFNIPSLYFTTNGESKTIAAAKLFPATALESDSDIEEKYCASIVFNNEEDKITLPSDTTQDVLLIITWTLFITNKKD